MDERWAVSDGTLDPIAILQSLGRPEPARADAISGGADTAIWRIEQDDQSFALRVFRADQATMARREVVAMAIARGGGIPVPTVCAEGSWQGRPALLLTWMPGAPLERELGARPWRAWALGDALGRTQAAIHSVPVPTAAIHHPVPWVEWAAPDDALRRCLHDRDSGEEALLHLDVHPMNVMVQGPRLTAVLDWANARVGDPRADLARTASMLRFAPLGAAAPAPIARIARRALIAGWRHGYRHIAGPVHGMALFYAWAGAVMVKDLSPRLGRHDLPWLTPAFLEEVRRWTMAWRSRAGLTE